MRVEARRGKRLRPPSNNVIAFAEVSQHLRQLISLCLCVYTSEYINIFHVGLARCWSLSAVPKHCRMLHKRASRCSTHAQNVIFQSSTSNSLVRRVAVLACLPAHPVVGVEALLQRIPRHQTEVQFGCLLHL